MTIPSTDHRADGGEGGVDADADSDDADADADNNDDNAVDADAGADIVVVGAGASAGAGAGVGAGVGVGAAAGNTIDDGASSVGVGEEEAGGGSNSAAPVSALDPSIIIQDAVDTLQTFAVLEGAVDYGFCHQPKTLVMHCTPSTVPWVHSAPLRTMDSAISP
jgi:hypothetical protein